MAGIYLHIPFCRQACHYCDFHFSTNSSIKEEMIRMMAEEILLQRDYLEGESLQTIYFGGGTPSLLDPSEVRLLLTAIFNSHPVSPGAEITLEANPDDLTLARLRDFKSVGINRLSIGVQSFDDEILTYLNRAHQARTAIESVDAAVKAGFENISIDLIYAIPGLTEQAWDRNLSDAIGLNPQHISAYGLTIEEKTVFGNWQRKGRLQPVAETLAAAQLERLMDRLSAAGYEQYEISNFAKPGFQSRHNSSYWRGVKYLGIGPSAHSYNLISRQFNVANNHLYLRSIKEGNVPCQVEILNRRDHVNEYILTTLRTDKGCNVTLLRRNFGYDLLGLHKDYIRQLQSHDLVTIEDESLRLTNAGRLLADKISSDLFLIE
ncbi:MAG TPA: radical SAM family heme chaperone HemW [Chryseosolibacter sp.]